MGQLTQPAQDMIAESPRRSRACVAPRDRRGERSSGRKRPTRGELEARVAKLDRIEAALAIGRRKGAESVRLAALLRRAVIERAVRDLLANPETRRWRTDAIVMFVFERQRELGLKRPFASSTLSRIVRRVLRESGRLVKDSV